MTEKEKAKAYDEAIERAKKLHGNGITEEIFPELKEREDDRIRKWIIDDIRYNMNNEPLNNSEYKKKAEQAIAWLEKQSKKSSWKPSKEEMDALYSLSYITNEYDEYKEDVITHLYQDLKREFFNDSSYENMFSLDNKEDDVRRRSTIQVLEYARSLDAYNQYGKADIDKNISWLEKQGEQKPTLPKWKYKKDNTPLLRDSIILNKYGGVAKSPSGAIVSDAWVLDYDELAKLPKEEKIEPKFKVGDWIITPKNKVLQITSIRGTSYRFNNESHYWEICYCDEQCHLWNIEDAKDGDVLACNEEILLFKSYSAQERIYLYCWYNGQTNNFYSKEAIDILLTTTNKVCPATKEQRNALMKAIKDAGYEWDAEKKELKKKNK